MHPRRELEAGSWKLRNMPRTHRSVVILCIAIVALAPFLGGAVPDYALLEVQWVLLPDLALGAVPLPVHVPGEQPLALLSLLPSRAPPAFALS
jgi:hypothetical protein